MPRSSVLSHLQRLEELTALLRGGSHGTVSELAAELRVSRRTLTRDIQVLRDRGLPIEADPGRGGGIRLHRRWNVSAVSLDYREAIDMLLSLAIAEKLGSQLFLKQLSSIRHKLSATFSESQKTRIRALRRRILIGKGAPPEVLRAYTPPQPPELSAIHVAFFEMQLLEIEYVDEHKQRTARRIEPQFLFLNWPVWYLLAWDHLRQAERMFRIDRIRSATLLPDTFPRRDETPFRKMMEGLAEPI